MGRFIYKLAILTFIYIKKMKKIPKRKILKALNAIVVLAIFLQPVGTPSILRAMAAGEPSTEAVSAPAPAPDPAPKEEPKKELAAPVAPKEAPAPASASDPAPKPVADPKVEPVPVVQVSAPTEIPAPKDNTTPPSTVTPTPTGTTPDGTPAANNTSSQSNGTISPDAAVTDRPATEEKGDLNTFIAENVKANSVDLGSIDPENTEKTAELATDKADYAPTDTAIITGIGFLPGQTYVLVIFSKDAPPVTKKVEVTTDENGEFVYAYQLDGNYRPDYTVTVSDRDGNELAKTTFKDFEIVKPTLKVNKVLIPSGDAGKFNLQIDGATAGTGANVGDGGTTGVVVTTVGSHTVSETAGTATSLADYGAVISGDCDSSGNVALAAGQNKVCTITNTRRGHIIVDKVTEPSGDLQSFTFTTSGTSYNGFSLADQDIPNNQALVPGTYSVSETPIAGWNLTSASCTSDYSNDDAPSGILAVNPADINLHSGETVTCIFKNTFTLPKLQIEKSNNKFPVDQHPGDDVTYTLVVTALQNDVNNVIVTDLSPNGFTYRGGSWTALSSVRGNIKNSPTTEPNYNLPGDWKLGDMKKDEVVTLTYVADISTSQDPGLYPDLAWTQGVDAQNGQVLGAGTNSNFVQDAFVGTKVSVIKTSIVKPASVKIEKKTKTNHKKNKIKKVIHILPATGANGAWPLLALVVLIAGIGLIAYGRKKGENGNNLMPGSVLKILPGLLIGIFLAAGSFGARAGTLTNLAARMEDPKTPVNTNSFLLGFVALDRSGNAVTVQCFKKGPADGGFLQFQTLNLVAGGTSGNCTIDPAVVPSDGTYQFHITATAGSESVTSGNVSVEVLTGGPGTPTNYQRTKVSNCENNIKATTASDGGKTVRVEIYRSTETAFTADASTLIKSIDVGSNQPVNYTDTVANCGSTYYYAVRAFDVFGNGSGVVSDERTVVRTTGGGTTTVTTNVAGAIPVAGGGAVSGAAAGGGAAGGTVEGAQTPSGEGQPPSGQQGGQVLGEEQAKAETQPSFYQRHKAGTVIGILLLLAAAYYLYAKGKNKKGGLKPPSDTPKNPAV